MNDFDASGHHQPVAEAGRRPTRIRAALLGAVATVALAGALVEGGAFSVATPAGAQALQDPQSDSFADVIAHVRGAVVSVKVDMNQNAANGEPDGTAMHQPTSDNPLEQFFQQFGGQRATSKKATTHPRMVALGSGFIISSDGYVVTNNHVVENAARITLTTDDSRSLPATIVGTDKKTDLALLKITKSGTYPYVQFASTEARVGDWVVAVGNPFGLGGTVTAGIISARGRDIGAGPYEDFLQIDAPVNRGNSGGPTFNAQGKVIGINTAIYSPSGGSVGIGFDIPAKTAQMIVQSLRDKRVVTRGWLGVETQPVTDDIADSFGLTSKAGALVANAQPDSPAAAAGIRSGDVILAVGGQKIDAPRDLAQKVASLGPNTSIDVRYWRSGAEHMATVHLGTMPNV